MKSQTQAAHRKRPLLWFVTQIHFVIFYLLFTYPIRTEVPVVFVSAPDPHFVDKYLKTPLEPYWYSRFNLFLDNIKQFNPSFLLFAGDLGEQHWWDPKFHAICASGGNLRDTILGCTAKSYAPFVS